MHCLRALRLATRTQLCSKNVDLAKRVFLAHPRCFGSSDSDGYQRRPAAHLDLFRLNVLSKSPSSGVEDMLFYTITGGKEQIPIAQFTSVDFEKNRAAPVGPPAEGGNGEAPTGFEKVSRGHGDGQRPLSQVTQRHRHKNKRT